jgi:hypothetical protein
MKNGQELRTEEGRAEILLAPGSFLRVGESTRVKMISNSIADVRLELFAGSALFEVTELEKGNGITLLASGHTVTIRKNGLYRFDMDPKPMVRVYEGEAFVEQNGKTATLKEARAMALDGEFLAARFDNKVGDALNRWARRRSEQIAVVNISSAKTVLDRGMSWKSGWMYNPWYGMWTFIPTNGYLRSPFGFGFYSPWEVSNVFYQPVFAGGRGGGWSGASTTPSWNSSLGYNTTDYRSSGGGWQASSGGYSGGSVSSAPAASSGGDGGVRGGGSGGGMAGGGGGGHASGGGTGGRGNQ